MSGDIEDIEEFLANDRAAKIRRWNELLEKSAPEAPPAPPAPKTEDAAKGEGA